MPATGSLEARLSDPDDEVGGVVELDPGRRRAAAGSADAQQRAPGAGSGRPRRPDLVPAPGLFAPPERFEARPFSPREAAATVLETAVEVLRARGEPARYERLLGEILVGLDRAGPAPPAARRRRAGGTAASRRPAARRAIRGGADRRRRAIVDRRADGTLTRSPHRPSTTGRGMLGSVPLATAQGAVPVMRTRTFARPPAPRDPVERVLALVADELGRPDQRRVEEIEPGRWWLGDRADREAAAIPLADRVEWAVYSLLSTAGPIAETAFFERVASLFSGHDLPDETLVRACLASYRSPASTASRLVTAEDLRRRTAEHTELLALLANGGHRLGMRVWLGKRDQARRIGDRTLGDFLDPHREREPWFPTVSLVPKEDGEAVDCIWYQRGASALLFEVEWTAMLGDVLLRRHARIPPDERIVRFLVLAPGAARARPPQARGVAAPARRAGDRRTGTSILWPHLRAWLEREPLDLADLEPYLGLDPAIERRAEQLGLFEAPNAVP